MNYIKQVEARDAAIKAHYRRGGFGENAPRPLCELCHDTGLVYDHRPVWNQVDEHSGYIEAEVVQVACNACPLAEALENEMAANVCETSAA